MPYIKYMLDICAYLYAAYMEYIIDGISDIYFQPEMLYVKCMLDIFVHIYEHTPLSFRVGCHNTNS